MYQTIKANSTIKRNNCLISSVKTMDTTLALTTTSLITLFTTMFAKSSIISLLTIANLLVKEFCRKVFIVL